MRQRKTNDNNSLVSVPRHHIHHIHASYLCLPTRSGTDQFRDSSAWKTTAEEIVKAASQSNPWMSITTSETNLEYCTCIVLGGPFEDAFFSHLEHPVLIGDESSIGRAVTLQRLLRRTSNTWTSSHNCFVLFTLRLRIFFHGRNQAKFLTRITRCVTITSATGLGEAGHCTTHTRLSLQLPLLNMLS